MAIGAGVAQPVEQRIRNAQVVSSSLTTSSKKKPLFSTYFVVRYVESRGFGFCFTAKAHVKSRLDIYIQPAAF